MNLQYSDSILVWESNRVRPRPEVIEIKEFRDLWAKVRKVDGDSDGRKKLQNIREFTWIFHTVSHKSPYIQYEESIRSDQVKKEVFGNLEWEPDELVLAAREKYIELIKSPVIKLLDASLNTLNKTATYLNNVDYDVKSEIGQVYTVRDVLSAIGNIGKLYDSLEILREKVAKEEETGGAIRAGVLLNEFSR